MSGGTVMDHMQSLPHQNDQNVIRHLQNLGEYLDKEGNSREFFLYCSGLKFRTLNSHVHLKAKIVLILIKILHLFHFCSEHLPIFLHREIHQHKKSNHAFSEISCFRRCRHQDEGGTDHGAGQHPRSEQTD